MKNNLKEKLKTIDVTLFFAVVVNMILINMMMAIINLAFEEIKANKSDFQSKFALLDYVKRTTREMIGLNVAEPIVPVYVGDENEAEEEEDEAETTERISDNFTQKTDRLLDYITRTYLADGFIETEEGKRVLAKMSISNGAPAVRYNLVENTAKCNFYCFVGRKEGHGIWIRCHFHGGQSSGGKPVIKEKMNFLLCNKRVTPLF